jgi:uncharacterized protein (TIGR02300 family)
MSNKAERGTKRTCQNPECGSRFYGLKHDPIVCPICNTVYAFATSATAAAAPVVAEEKAVRKAPKKPVYPVASAKPEEAPEAEEALADVEGVAEPVAAEEDETFLEAEEEDGSDMSGIIGGPVAEPDEPQ